MARMTRDGIEMILRFEGFVGHPYWPGGASGVTLDFGYDLGYVTPAQLFSDWLDEGRVTCPGGSMEVQLLLQCVGKIGEEARSAVQLVKDCIVNREDAAIVFEKCALPRYESATRRAFPMVDSMPDQVFSALVSLVFNRGGDMGNPGTPSWDRRAEMRAIRTAVKDNDVSAIARAIVSMKRLWAGTNQTGLLRRRDAEAAMVESVLA